MEGLWAGIGGKVGVEGSGCCCLVVKTAAGGALREKQMSLMEKAQHTDVHTKMHPHLDMHRFGY